MVDLEKIIGENKIGVPINILIIEDIEVYVAAFKRNLNHPMINIIHASTARDAENFLISSNVDVILLDLFLDDSKGADTFHRFKNYGVPIIVNTSSDDIDMATTLIKEGALDYCVKPVISSNMIFKILVAAKIRQNSIPSEDWDEIRKHIRLSFC